MFPCGWRACTEGWCQRPSRWFSLLTPMFTQLFVNWFELLAINSGGLSTFSIRFNPRGVNWDLLWPSLGSFLCQLLCCPPGCQWKVCFFSRLMTWCCISILINSRVYLLDTCDLYCSVPMRWLWVVLYQETTFQTLSQRTGSFWGLKGLFTHKHTIKA